MHVDNPAREQDGPSRNLPSAMSSDEVCPLRINFVIRDEVIETPGKQFVARNAIDEGGVIMT
jgi:hypothetical protein